MTKKSSLTKHAKERIEERYNLSLTEQDENSIITLIRENKATYLYDSEKDKQCKFCYVVYKNIPLKVLYKKSETSGAKRIITAYPFDVEEYNSILDKEYQQKLNQFNSRINAAIIFLKKNGYIVYKREKKKEIN